jgi:AcrR family transcriptional regulator
MARISKEQQEQIRKKIIDVARLRFVEMGFEQTSTKQIAKEVGIAEGTLFNYFESKTDLFFDVFKEEYEATRKDRVSDLKMTSNISEMLLANFEKTMGLVMKLPRGLLGEFTLASIRMAKRKPEKFKRLMEMDFQFMGEIATYIEQLIAHQLLEEVDAKVLSEIIFGIIGYELLLYMYESSVKKDQIKQNIKQKLDIILKGYLKGE